MSWFKIGSDGKTFRILRAWQQKLIHRYEYLGLLEHGPQMSCGCHRNVHLLALVTYVMLSKTSNMHSLFALQNCAKHARNKTANKQHGLLAVNWPTYERGTKQIPEQHRILYSFRTNCFGANWLFKVRRSRRSRYWLQHKRYVTLALWKYFRVRDREPENKNAPGKYLFSNCGSRSPRARMVIALDTTLAHPGQTFRIRRQWTDKHTHTYTDTLMMASAN